MRCRSAAILAAMAWSRVVSDPRYRDGIESQAWEVLLASDVCQELASRAAMVRHGRQRESPDLLQIDPVGGDALLDPRQRGVADTGREPYGRRAPGRGDWLHHVATAAHAAGTR